jgi:hypothetical protein
LARSLALTTTVLPMLQMEQRLVQLTKENRARRDKRQLCWLCQAAPVGQKTPHRCNPLLPSCLDWIEMHLQSQPMRCLLNVSFLNIITISQPCPFENFRERVLCRLFREFLPLYLQLCSISCYLLRAYIQYELMIFVHPSKTCQCE